MWALQLQAFERNKLTKHHRFKGAHNHFELYIIAAKRLHKICWFCSWLAYNFVCTETCMQTEKETEEKRAKTRGNEEFVKFTCEFQLCEAHVTKSIFSTEKRNEMNASESEEKKTKTNNKRYFPMKLFAFRDSRAKVPKILFKSIALAWRCIHLLSRHFNINENPLNRGKDNCHTFCITSNLWIPDKWAKKKINELKTKTKDRHVCERIGRQYFIVSIHVFHTKLYWFHCLFVIRTRSE